MARSAISLSRSGARFKPHPSILVICEDTKSGKQYLDDASLHFRVDAKVEISHCGKTDPKGIIESALLRQKRFDRVFCVIDRDDHVSFDEALIIAQKSPKISVIASYPCFEFWYLLHFKYTRKSYTSVGNASAGDRLITDLKTIPDMTNYSKGDRQGLFASLLGEKFEHARNAAPKIHKEAIAENEMNPSTTVYELINFFEELSAPQELVNK
ncbi:MAG: RloB family protein [Sulfurimicrobium sp.]|nr:RloB family protein [Sulfurimicrobium sp.]MDP1703973.1 RloB family protein [Sulfurimicrobium sp.]MDP2198029.1 RloB family protein [Sulfurimicrobium sp.]